jgi:hypothetical protein
MTRTAPSFARRKLGGFSDPALNLMASAFQDHETVSVLGDRILLYVTQHREFVLFKYLISNGYVIASYDDLELIFDVHHLADYHLLSLPFNATLSPIQESTRLALYISAWLNSLSFEPGLAYTFALVHQLQKALQEVEPPTSSKPAVRLLTWVLFIGAHISRTRAERPWFIQHLARATQLLGLESVGQLRDLLFNFFYMEKIYGPSLPQIWTETRSAA